jgi:hypothetical protein
MRYFVTIQSGKEMGPYEETDVRQWLAAGTMPRDAPTRAEYEPVAQPACIVFPGVAPSLSVNLPPEPIEPYRAYRLEEPVLQPGSYLWGFFAALAFPLLSLVYLLTADHVKPRTERGIMHGHILPLIGGVFAVILVLASGQ